MTEAPSSLITRRWQPAPAAVPARTPQTTSPIPYDLVLDWRHHHLSDRPRPCRWCHGPALLLDDDQRPCHKTCAEQHLWRELGPAGAYAAVHASYRPRTRAKASA